MSYRKQAVLAVVLSLLMIGAPLSGAVGATDSDTPAESIEATSNFDDVQEVTDNVGVWERSVLPFRADTDAAMYTVENDNTFIVDQNDEQRRINRPEAGVYQTNNNIQIDYSSDVDAATTMQFGEEDAQFIVGYVDEDIDEDDGSLSDIPMTTQEVLDEINSDNLDNVNNNVSFTLEEETQLNDDGSAEFDFEPENSGSYFGMLAVAGEDESDGFSVTNGDLEIDDKVVIIGVEQWMAQDDVSEVDAPDVAAPGEDLIFNVDATELSDDLTHTVTVYHEETFVDSRQNLNITEEPTTGISQDDIILEHDIDELNGVQDIDGDIEVFGNSLEDRTETGTIEVADIVDFLAAEIDAADPNTRVLDSTTIDTSTIAVGDADADTELTVETLDDWEEGEYQWIHTATGDSTSEIQTNADTLTIDEDEAAELESIDLELDDTTIEEGETTTATVTANFDDGSTETVTDEADIESLNQGVATVDGNTITGESAGDATIEAEFDGEQDTVELTVTEPPEPPEVDLESIDLDLDDDTIEEGETTTATVTANFDDGSTETVTNDATIESDDEDVATVDGNTITGESEGDARIEAEFDGEEDTAELTVTEAVEADLESIDLELADDTLEIEEVDDEDIGEETTATVTAEFTNDSTQDVTDEATIESLNTDRVSVDGATLTAVGQGSAPIEATFEGETDTETVRVERVETSTIQDNVAAFERTENLRELTFDEAPGLEGQDVTARESDTPPAQAPQLPPEQQSISSMTIGVPDEATDTAATIQSEIAIDQLEEIDADPEDLSVLRAVDDGYDELESEVVDQTEEKITIEAETPGFSTFAITAEEEVEDDLARYANEDGVIETDGLREAIDDWRNGDIETDTLRDVIDAWRSGEQVVDPEPPELDEYTNEDGVIETDGLREAIDDWRNGDIETDTLRDVIDAWRSGEPIE